VYYDALIRIKNAQSAGKKKTRVLFTKANLAILSILLQNKFISGMVKKGKGVRRILEVDLRYREDGEPAVKKVVLVSKPSKKIYVKVKELKQVRQGFGLGVISTPKGVMSVAEAKKNKLGGEYLFKVW